MKKNLLYAAIVCAALSSLGAQEESSDSETDEGASGSPGKIDRTPLQGQLVWPQHLTVFAPMDEMDAKLDSALLATVPQKPTVPAQGNFPEWSIQARKESPSLAGERTRNRDGTYTNS